MTNLSPLKHYTKHHLPLTNDKFLEDAMSSSNYDVLRETYPKFISKDQLRKICGISPLSSQYLIKNCIIPSINTGKKTWRYKISLEDVIAYLKAREQKGSMIPKGAVTSTDKKLINPVRSFASIMSKGMEKKVRAYFFYISEGYPDVLTVSGLAEISGVCRKTIMLHIKQGHIKYLKNGVSYLVPKKYALDYLSSPIYINMRHHNKTFERIWGGFQIWIAKSSQ